MGKHGPWRWPVVAVAFVLSLSAMVGAQRWYTSHLTGPAIESLEALEGVRTVRLAAGPSGRIVEVELLPVEDVPGLVGDVLRLAQSGRLGRVQEVVLVDRRDETLARALIRIQLPLQEGAFSGAFTTMEDRITRLSRDLDLDESRVFVDGRAVYLFLRHGDRYLYELVPRPHPAGDEPWSVPVRVRGADEPFGEGGPAR